MSSDVISVHVPVLKYSFRCDEPDLYGAIFPDNVVGQRERLFDVLVGGVLEREVYLGRFVHHAEAARLRPVESDECLREDVLTGVLLNMIEAAVPVHAALDDGADLRRAALYDVEHVSVLLVYAFDDGRAIE